MKALIHLAAPDLKPIGLWYIDKDGDPHSVYVDVSPLAVRAADFMASKVPDVSWLDYWENQLVNIIPYIDTFEVIDVPDDATDDDLKKQLLALT